MIENRINAPQKRASKGRQTMGEKLVERIALVDTTNLDTPTNICIVHKILFEALAELLFQFLLQRLNLTFERCHALFKRGPEHNRWRGTIL